MRPIRIPGFVARLMGEPDDDRLWEHPGPRREASGLSAGQPCRARKTRGHVWSLRGARVSR